MSRPRLWWSRKSSFTKPQVGGSTDTWGTKNNANWDAVDAIFAGAGTGTSVGINIGSGKTAKVDGTLNVTSDSGGFKTWQGTIPRPPALSDFNYRLHLVETETYLGDGATNGTGTQSRVTYFDLVPL